MSVGGPARNGRSVDDTAYVSATGIGGRDNNAAAAMRAMAMLRGSQRCVSSLTLLAILMGVCDVGIHRALLLFRDACSFRGGGGGHVCLPMARVRDIEVGLICSNS